MTKYDVLLSTQRRRQSEVKDRNLNLESESDRGRFLFSSPFRRMQQKAQVFSLESNAAVRSRLTHSLEVSQVGRYIAQLVFDKLVGNVPELNGKRDAFVNFVETACLMHDVGNPPFGHLGEFAIQEWFNKNSSCAPEKVQKDCQFNNYLNDFKFFDGNNQGLRIITRLQWNNDEFGLNLTYTQLLSYLKYVVLQKDVDSNSEIKKKSGYFITEQKIIEECWDNLGMQHHTRHPLVYIMEAADDIAYSISDIEDALEKKLIQFSDFQSQMKKEAEGKNSEFARNINDVLNKLGEKLDDYHLSPFTDFRTHLTRLLTEYAASCYVRNHNEILQGISQPIFSKSNHDDEAKFLACIKKFAADNIYITAAAADNELAGYAVLGGLLDHFKPLLLCERGTFEKLYDDNSKSDDPKPTKLLKRLFALLPKRYLNVYKNELKSNIDDATECLWRTHIITDYISGMTDDFALQTYQLLSGIKVGQTSLTK